MGHGLRLRFGNDLFEGSGTQIARNALVDLGPQ